MIYIKDQNLNEEKVSETIKIVFDATQKQIDQMETGDRITNKAMVEMVAEETGFNASIANGLVSLYVENHGDVKKRAGRAGGIFKNDVSEKVEKDHTSCDSCHQPIFIKTGE